MITQIILIFFAAICKALADSIAFHQGGIFHGCKGFDINKQGEFLPHTKYPLDAYHLSNTAMVICFCLLSITQSNVSWLLTIAVLGVVYNLTFNFFFNHILNEKQMSTISNNEQNNNTKFNWWYIKVMFVFFVIGGFLAAYSHPVSGYICLGIGAAAFVVALIEKIIKS